MRRSVPVRLALAVAAAAAPGLATTERLPTDVVPRSQSIELRADPAAERYAGAVEIELEAVREAPRFALHARGQEIGSLRLLAPDREVPAAWREVPAAWRIEAEREELVVEPASPLPSGRYRLELEFTQAYNRRAVALYRSDVGGTPYVFSQFQAVDAREAFPCFDEPGFKIPYRLTVEHPDGLVAISNTPVESESTADGWRRVAFRRTPPLPSYLLALAIGPFDLVDVPGGSVPIRIVTAKGQGGRAAFAVAETPPILAEAERWFGRPYPFEKLDLLAVPDFAYGAMENPGAITFRDEILLRDAAQLSQHDRRQTAAILAHEIAHMWFGDLVTMEWWTEFWLNESFADWVAAKIAGAVHPGIGVGAAGLDQIDAVMRDDARPSSIPIQLPPGSGPGDAFATVGVAYGKGKAIFNMVEAWVGEEPFRRGVVAYLEKHAWGSTRGADLWAALDRETGRDVSTTLRTFVEQPSYPLLDVEPRGDGVVRIRQSRYVLAGDAPLPALVWRVPVELVWSDDEGVHRRIVLLEGPTTVIRLPVRGDLAWLHPDGGARGYYRWRLPDADLAALLAHASDALSTLERARLLDDLAALLQADAIDGGAYVRRVAEFVADPAPEVAASALRQIGALARAFRDDPAFAGFVRVALAPVRERALVRPATETSAEADLRAVAFGTLGLLGDSPEARAAARRHVDAMLDDPATADPAIAPMALLVAARNGDEALWTRLRSLYESTEDPQLGDLLLSPLVAFDDPRLVVRGLEYAFSEAVPPPDRLGVLFTAAAFGDASRARVADWIFEQWERVAGGLPPYHLAEVPQLLGGCSRELAGRAEAFFGPRLEAHPELGRALRGAIELDGSCAALRDREGASVAVALRELAALADAPGEIAQ